MPPLARDVQNLVFTYLELAEIMAVNKKYRDFAHTKLLETCNTIGTWYKARRPNQYYITKHEFIRYFCVHYPHEWCLEYPEFCVAKLNLNPLLLAPLPHRGERKKSDVIMWLRHAPVSFLELLYVGW
jgi:hypothetical protein